MKTQNQSHSIILYRLVKRKFFIRLLKTMFKPDPEHHMVNVGSGNWYYPRWETIDLKADDLYVDYRIDLEETHYLPFNNESCDLIFCSNLIYYLSEKSVQLLFEEFYSVLRNDGTLRIVVSDYDNPLCDDNQHPTRITHFNNEKLYSMLRKSGFKNIIRCCFRESKINYFRKPIFDRNPDFSLIVECRKV